MNKTNLRHILIFILIIIVAIFLRSYNIRTTPPGLYPDEAMNGNNALEAIQTNSFKVFYPENNGREGLFINIEAFFIALWGNYPWVLRLVSALFGIGTVVGMYFLILALLAKEKRKYSIAQAATFFLAISFWHINFSRIGFRAIMAPFFLVWALVFVLQGLNRLEKPTSKKWKTMALPILGGLLFGLGMHSYIAYRATPLIIVALFVLWRWYHKTSYKKLLSHFFLFVVAAIITFAPLGIYFAKNPADFLGRTSQVSVFSSASPLLDLAKNVGKTLLMFNISGDWNWRHNFAGAPELFWPIGILFLADVVLGITKMARRFQKESGKNLPFWLSIVWITVGLLPVVISDEGIPHALRAILVIPPIFILAALGWNKIQMFIENHLGKQATMIVVAIASLVLFVHAYAYYFIQWGQNPNVEGAFNSENNTLAREIEALPATMTKYIVVDTGGVLVRGVPMPSQTIMFLTDTFTQQGQQEKNIHYLIKENEDTIPQNAQVFYIQ